jgi:hypothetical protein
MGRPTSRAAEGGDERANVRRIRRGAPGRDDAFGEGRDERGKPLVSASVAAI